MSLILKIAGAILLADVVKVILSFLCDLIVKAVKDSDNEPIKVNAKGSNVIIDINGKIYTQYEQDKQNDN